jgi:hypothetical protein
VDVCSEAGESVIWEVLIDEADSLIMYIEIYFYITIHLEYYSHHMDAMNHCNSLLMDVSHHCKT